MELSKMVEPKSDIVFEAKKSYNRILKRHQEATKYLDDPAVPMVEKDKRLLTFRIEIINVLEVYLQVFKDWGIVVTDNEILNGFSI